MSVGSKGFRSNRPAGWKDFAPRLDCWNNNFGGVGTPPVLGGAGSLQNGRYLYLPDQKLCHYSFDVRFGPGCSAGGGTQNILAGNYLLELPVPAKNFDSQPGLAGSPPGDRSLGMGLVFQGNGVSGSSPLFPQIPVLFTNADCPPVASGGSRDKWAQMFVSYSTASGGVWSTFQGTAGPLSGLGTFTLPGTPASLGIGTSGTGTIMCSDGIHTITWTGTSGSTLTTCTYSGSSAAIVAVGAQFQANVGTFTSGTTLAVTFPFTLNTAPQAGEIVLQWTSNYTATTKGPYFVSGVSTTGFTINVTAAPTTPATFQWVLTSYKSTLVNAQTPFNLGANIGDCIRGSMTYETAT